MIDRIHYVPIEDCELFKKAASLVFKNVCDKINELVDAVNSLEGHWANHVAMHTAPPLASSNRKYERGDVLLEPMARYHIEKDFERKADAILLWVNENEEKKIIEYFVKNATAEALLRLCKCLNESVLAKLKEITGHDKAA